ncbi:hypothetical protein AAVH_15007 [Aphelenchoides avenae]|nr:hypothetical protein AAVH_15007 [Aphelenchus avenae]
MATAVEFSLYFFHFLFGYHFVKNMHAVSLMHPNLRLLMCNIIVEYTLVGIGRIGNYCLIRFDIHNPFLCSAFRITQDTGIEVASLTFVWIALERLMATVLIQTYEQKTSRVGTIIVVLSYLLTFTCSAGFTLYDALVTDGFSTIEVCETYRMHPQILPVIVPLALLNYVFVLTLLAALYWYNKRMKSRQRGVSLSARYQYGENVATLAVLVPAIVIWGVVVVWALPLVSWYYWAWKNEDLEAQLLINRLIYLLAALNSIVCPMAFVLKYTPLNTALRMEVRKWACRENRTECSSVAATNAPSAEELTNLHFQQLHDTWNKESPI